MRKYVATWTWLLWSVGCGGQAPAERAVEEAPFELTQSGTLKVRDDLAALLKGTKARADRRTAEVEGTGHVMFAPGAAYAAHAPFGGYVERVHVQVGDHVVAGTPLATLRSSDLAHLRADARRMAAELAMETDAASRAERLVRQGAASPREFIAAQARVDALQADLAGTHQALAAAHVPREGADTYTLRASRPGEVLSRAIDPGERVQAGDEAPVMQIGDANALVVAVHIPERDTALVAQQAPCTVALPALGGASFAGRVVSVTRAIDPLTRTARIVCAPDGLLDPHVQAEMAARVSVGIQSDAAVVVPRDAILLRRDQRMVFVRQDNGELQRRAVATGLRIGDGIQVLEGLQPGEEVITEGAVLLDGELDRLL